jgi:chromosome segregation ATPase
MKPIYDEMRQLERELAEARKQRDEWFEVFAKNLKEKGNLRDHLAEAQDKIEELVEIGLTQMDKERSLKRELAEAREIVEMQKETMRQMREKYGIGERNVMRELRQEIENLNKIIDAATNSANASHLRAIEYQSQRDMLAEALEDYELGYTDGELARLATCETGLGEISPADANREIRRRQALATVKGGES